MTYPVPPAIPEDVPQARVDGAVHENEIGELHGLTEYEHLAVMTGLRMVAAGEDVTPEVARQCMLALARIAGIPIPDKPAPPHVVSL